MEKIILLVYLLFFSVQSFGSVIVSGEFNEPLKPHLVFYHDETGKLRLDEIKKKKFDIKKQKNKFKIIE